METYPLLVGGVQVNDIPTFRSDQMPYDGATGSGARGRGTLSGR